MVGWQKNATKFGRPKMAPQFFIWIILLRHGGLFFLNEIDVALTGSSSEEDRLLQIHSGAFGARKVINPD